jgi:hypothetical protein
VRASRAPDASSAEVAEAAAFLASYGDPHQARAALARLAAIDPANAALAPIERRLAARSAAPRASY